MKINEVNLTLTRRIPIVQWKRFVGVQFTEQQREVFGFEQVKEVLESYRDKSLGVFIGIKDSKVKTIKGSFEDLRNNHIVVTVEATACFYEVKEKEIIPILVEKINNKGLIGSCYGEPVDIPLEYLSVLSGVYNPSTEVYQVGDIKIKSGDLLLGKVTNYTLTKVVPMKEEPTETEDANPYRYLIRASCKNQGAGKINFSK